MLKQGCHFCHNFSSTSNNNKLELFVLKIRQYKNRLRHDSLVHSWQHHTPTQRLLSSRTVYHLFSRLPKIQQPVSLNHRHRIRFYDNKCSFTTTNPGSSKDDDSIDPELYQYLKECLSDVDFVTADAELDSIARAIVKTLLPVYGNNVSVSKLQNFGRSGIRELALSIHREQERKRVRTVPGKKAKLQIQINIPHHTTEFVGTWRLGQSLLDVAKQNHPELLGEYMEGTCGGQMSCCTCHVYLDDTTFQLVQPTVDEAELDMLDLAYEPKTTSRLGCQVQLTPSLLQSIQDKNHTVTLTIPAGVNDVWK